MNRYNRKSAPWRRAAVLVAVAGVLGSLTACAPLVVGGAMVGGSLMVVDRRTPGAQIEDQGIELKASSLMRQAAPQGHLNATSYNRTLLLTGEVASEAERKGVEQAVARIENLRAVVNELAVAGSSSLTARSNDAILSAKVKATFVDAADLQAQSIKVVTERSTVFLMGRVTEREAGRAADLAAKVSGVQKVVRIFEILSEQELAALQGRAAPR